MSQIMSEITGGGVRDVGCRGTVEGSTRGVQNSSKTLRVYA
jgi:hypothetical protein